MLPALARTGLRAASMPRPAMMASSSRVTQLVSRRGMATDRTGQRGDAKAKLVSQKGHRGIAEYWEAQLVIELARSRSFDTRERSVLYTIDL